MRSVRVVNVCVFSALVVLAGAYVLFGLRSSGTTPRETANAGHGEESKAVQKAREFVAAATRERSADGNFKWPLPLDAERALDELVAMGPDAVPGISLLIESDVSQIRDLAGYAMAAMEHGCTIQEFQSGVLADGSPLPEAKRCPWMEGIVLEAARSAHVDTRRFALEFACLQTSEPAAVLAKLAQDGDDETRWRATERLGMCERTGAAGLETLRGLLDDPSAEVACAAALAVGLRKDQRSLSQLLLLLDDDRQVDGFTTANSDVMWKGYRGGIAQPKAAVREVAAWAIQRITGNDYGFVSCLASRPDIEAIIKRIRADVRDGRD